MLIRIKLCAVVYVLKSWVCWETEWSVTIPVSIYFITDYEELFVEISQGCKCWQPSLFGVTICTKIVRIPEFGKTC
jgi:hypothetical protein